MKLAWSLIRNVAGAAVAFAAAMNLAAAQTEPRSVRVRVGQMTGIVGVNEKDLLVTEGVLPPGTVIEVPVDNYKNAESMPYWNDLTASQRQIEFVKGIRVVSVPGYSEQDIKELNSWRSVENLYIAKKQLAEAIVVGMGAGGDTNKMRLRARTSIRRNDGRQILPPQTQQQQDAEDTVKTVDRMNDAVNGAGSAAQTYGICSKDVYKKFLDAGVPKKPLDQALARLAQNRDRRIKRTDYMAIADFTQDSNKKRLFVLNLKTGDVDSLYTAHGRGRSANTNTHLHMSHFGNGPSSFLTPPGFHITSDVEHNPRKGLSLRLEGLEARNSNSAARGILIHGQHRDYATEAFVRANGHTGRSEGCLTVDPAKLTKIVKELQGGALVYNYVGDGK